jgi:hypothetical protein
LGSLELTNPIPFEPLELTNPIPFGVT